MIKKGTLAELKDIKAIYDDARNLFKSKGINQWLDLDGYPNENSIIDDINNDQLYVKVYKGVIVGVISLQKAKEKAYEVINDGSWLNDDEYYVIHRIAIKDGYYGMGFAKELMLFCEDEAIKDGVFNIKVDTRDDNIMMSSLLEKLGYRKCGIIYLLRKNMTDNKRVAYQKILKNNI